MRQAELAALVADLRGLLGVSPARLGGRDDVAALVHDFLVGTVGMEVELPT